jgi:MEMO1 family protein
MRIVQIILVLLLAVPSLLWGQDASLKPSNVAGGFYSDDPKVLSADIDHFLSSADVSPRKASIAIVPHAGYLYSGQVAAHTFKALSQNTYNTIVVIAPSHFHPFDGAAIWPKGGFQTPLGTVAIDEKFSDKLLKTSTVKNLPDAFAKEHALEVELPFIQKVFPKAKLVALVMGQPDSKTCGNLAGALHEIIGQRDDVLVLISSDLSHYHPYTQAQTIDQGTLGAIKLMDIEGVWSGVINQKMEMCGFVPAIVGMMLAKLQGNDQVEILKYANSGDTTGEKAKVVGYAAVLFYKSPEFSKAQKGFLVRVARENIETFLKKGKTANIKTTDARLNRVQGAFVTIHKDGQLRGCIGNVIGQKPLVDVVADMAIAAAVQDPRFPPVTVEELKDIDVEVSVLSIPKPTTDIASIELGRDGVILSDKHNHQGIFLPQVATETKWSKDEFLSQLCQQKAELPPDCYKRPDVSLYTFTAEVFGEK